MDGYSYIRRDRKTVSKSRGGGLLTYFRNGLKISHNNDVSSGSSDIEALEFSLASTIGSITFKNIYIPPGVSRLPSSYDLGDMAFGDFNAHHESWSQKVPTKSAGSTVFDWINDNGLELVQLKPTIPKHGTTPDLVLHSPQHKCLSVCQYDPDALMSDHTPILADFDITTFSNFSQFQDAHWTAFSDTLESHTTRLLKIKSLKKLSNNFVHTVEKVAIAKLPNKWCKPRHKGRERILAPLSPSQVASQGCDKGFSWTYRKIRELRGDKTALPTPRAPMASLISRFFPSGSDSTRPEAPKVKPGDYETPECSPFSQEEARAVFSSLKRTNSAGPDSISNNMLLHLGPQMILVLLRIANWSLRRGILPECFKKANVIPFLKGNGKDPSEPSSYRPISMTSIVAKFIEALILRRLEHLLEGSLDPNQSGFVPGRTTDENIAILANAASETRQDFEKCGVLLFFDISGAFDNVSHRILVERLIPLLPKPYVRWLVDFLSNRSARLLYGKTYSKDIGCNKGVPQGSILGPLLFRLYVDTLPQSVTKADIKLLYADDLSVFVSSNKIGDLETKANEAIGQVESWLSDSNMSLSQAKTEFLAIGTRFDSGKGLCRFPRLYLPSTKRLESFSQPSLLLDKLDEGPGAQLNLESGPVFPLTVNGRDVSTRTDFRSRVGKKKLDIFTAIPIRRVEHARYLGVLIDDRLTFEPQLNKVTSTMKRGIGLLKMISSFEIKTEVLRQLVNGLVLARAYHGLAAYAPYLRRDSWKRVETIHRKLMLKLTGCSSSASVQAVSVESDILPFKQHLAKSMALIYERYQRYAENAPTWSLFNGEGEEGRWESSATHFSKCFPTPSVKSRFYLPHHQAPWEPPPNVTVLPSRDFRKSPDTEHNLNYALASIESLPPAIARVYTDASYFEDKDGCYHCGNAAVLVFRNKCYTKLQRYNPSLMIYNAEQRALISALDIVRDNSPQLPNGRIHIISDSQSSLSSLAKGYLCQHSRTNHEILSQISTLNRPFTMQFVPSHCGVIGNELADSLASKAASSEIPLTEVPFDYRMAQCSIVNQVRKAWLRSRDTRHVHNLATSSGRVQKFHQDLLRSDEIIIARVRTGHHELVKLPALGLTDCRFCNHTDTDAHHLLSRCNGARIIVQQFFPDIPQCDDPTNDGQHHHTFFATENQPKLAAMLKDLESYLQSFPLRAALPRQWLLRHLVKFSNLPKLTSRDKLEVLQAIDNAYNHTVIEEIHNFLWTVELFCYNGIEKTQFTDLLNKIHYANYERIERKWFDYKVRGPPTRSYIDILFKINP